MTWEHSHSGWRGGTALLIALAAALAVMATLCGAARAATAPAVSEESALAGPSSVIVRAKIAPGAEAVECRLQYTPVVTYESDGYGGAGESSCEPASLPAGEASESVLAEVGELEIETSYEFRFVVTTAGGDEVAGASMAFATFGIESFAVGLQGEHGEAFSQAGGHPYEYVTTIAFSHGTDPQSPSGDVKDIEVELPPGLVGNPAATSTCASHAAEEKECSGASQVGTMVVEYGSMGGKEGASASAALFDVQPPIGVAAEFSGRFNNFTNAFIDAHVRTGSDYGIDADSLDITSIVDVRRVIIDLWGVPAASSHDEARSCSVGEGGVNAYKSPCDEKGPLTPFVSAPTQCTGAELSERVVADAYQAPGEFVERSGGVAALTGCGAISFQPSISVVPETTSTDSPSGLKVEVKVPQNEEPEGVATADLKDATVALPAGVTVNPAEASGLVGCTEAEIELHGAEPQKCPEASKVGTVELETPLIKREPEHPLPGAIYLAQQGNDGPAQGSNPFGSLLALYIAVEDPETGVIIKLAGKVEASPTTGQLSATFDENPQLPFSDFKLDFFSGERAPLATPETCGTYTATSLLEPWSHEAAGETGTPDASPTGSFAITSLAGGGACGTPPFAPTLTAGTTSNQAGGFSPLTTIVQRKDGEQALKSVSVTLPAGVAAMISQVPQCGEAEADAGTCSAASQIGHVTVQAGVGSEPLTLPEAGKREDPVYLTGPFEGAPFGLSIVVHPEAGPFNLEEGGHPVVVRAKLEVNPHTAQATISTPASGPYAMPTILQGIPVDVQSIDVEVDRPDFVFNATSCNATSVTGTIGSAEGASAAVSSRYQAANCASLPFKPKFSASTRGTTSRRKGASLTVKIKYPKTGEANIAKVKVQLPTKLPSRLATLEHSCTEAQFAANPAGCPAESQVGTAKAVTPILRVPLQGPVYFVSHAGLKFPELIAVLQGEGVTIDLAGETFISKKGVTTSTFATVPDEPISSFELKLPESEHSALAAPGGKLCQDKLKMPTTITGQNGKLIEQSTSIKVEGCSKKISFASHKVKGRRATVKVYVPTAGKLKASGKGLRAKSKTARGRGDVTFVLRQKKVGRLSTHVSVSFKPKKGKKQSKKVKLKFVK